MKANQILGARGLHIVFSHYSLTRAGLLRPLPSMRLHGPHRLQGPEKAGWVSYYESSLLGVYILICTVSSGLRLGGASEFVFTLRTEVC